MKREITGIPTLDPLMSADGFPVSGDGIRPLTYDNHPTQPFRMPELLWSAVRDMDPQSPK